MKKSIVLFMSGIALLLSNMGCISGNRILRNTPAGEDLEIHFNQETVNLWPLYYHNDDFTSVLWPLFDLDSRGFAVRPFYCQEGNEASLLWPLSGWDPDGGWALGCRIDGGQAEYVRVPYADQGLTRIPDGVSDSQALFTGDLLATGFWAARIAEITPGEDTVLIIGAGPTGICTLLCAMLRRPRRIIVCEKSPERRRFVLEHYPEVTVTDPEHCLQTVRSLSAHGGADAVLEVAGTEETFRMAWECARPNAVVTIVAMYDRPQVLPLPDMYGKNLIFKTGGVDGCDCHEILRLIAEGRIDATPLITHRFPLSRIEEAYSLFASHADGVIKVAVEL